MLFYVLIDQKGTVSFSPVPDVDKHYKKLLRPALPLSYLQYYLSHLSALEGNLANQKKSLEDLENMIINLLLKGLKKDGAILEEQFFWAEERLYSSKIMDEIGEEVFSKFLKMIQGRQITERELVSLAKIINISDNDLIKLLQVTVSQGLGEWIPALQRDKSGWICQRCNSSEIQEWPSLYGKTATCLECKILGPQTSLQTIFRSNPKKCYHKPVLNDVQEELCQKWSIEFTFEQARAAKKLVEYSSEIGSREVLLWAACGAGKTEVGFPLIDRYLADGKKVLFAAPRQDVVHDVHPRLQKNFPNISINLLSGAVPPKFEESPLTVATTHQVLKFYRYFDLIIFDEVDAYPYSGSAALNNGIKMALREEGQLVYLTATPTDELLKKSALGQCLTIKLPVRHHGQSLPLPLWKKVKLNLEYPYRAEKIIKGSDIKKVEEQMKEVMVQGPLLIFVPVVALVEEWVRVTRRLFPSRTVEGSWSSDPNRTEKIKNFQERKYDLFVTTSILERGITVPKVQVIVLYADHEIFDVRSLVQMAGRVGRTAEDPTGTVLFLADRETTAMKSSIEWIEEQNSFASRGGI